MFPAKTLEVFVRPIPRVLKVASSPAGLATLVSKSINPALIVFEATANWHLAAVAANHSDSKNHPKVLLLPAHLSDVITMRSTRTLAGEADNF
jgi:hypothetical protein